MINRRKRYNLSLKQRLLKILFVILGVLLAAFGLKGFLLPNEFIDGGVTGISLLANHITGLPVSVWLLVFNAPFILLGLRQIGKPFALYTLFAVVGLSLVIFFFDFPVITHDKLLISIFGGFFLGAGIGFAMRGGCVLDGTEIIAVYINRKSVFSIGDIIMIINVAIFICAAFILGIESALYSILTYLSASKTVDFIIQGIEEYTGVTIISAKSHEIKEAITTNLKRGVTVYKGERGYGGNQYSDKEIDIIFTVVTRLEVSKIKDVVRLIDRKAFMVMNVISETNGGLIKRRPLH
ncbi:YitT family protein [Arcticibacter tournemirensis]|uniref:YitT family protein n=1 Tax=Arcticibacter tournemirensis TaxID=699437 RepID=A0A4Q0M9A4_9SPHI|nr:YitT family protein [Arcticibacter tournemirensis]RXF69757.1 YitT family protein [Arcticibacter tournemirensis]